MLLQLNLDEVIFLASITVAEREHSALPMALIASSIMSAGEKESAFQARLYWGPARMHLTLLSRAFAADDLTWLSEMKLEGDSYGRSQLDRAVIMVH